MPRTPTSPEQRFWTKVDKRGPQECWLWTGAKSVKRKGRPAQYGQLSALPRGTLLAAHRLAYEIQVGPVPPGLTVDHLCGDTLCQNGAHLEAVTFEENTRRQWDRRGRATVCPSGHLVTDANTYWKRRRRADGTVKMVRECAPCKREDARVRRLRRGSATPD